MQGRYSHLLAAIQKYQQRQYQYYFDIGRIGIDLYPYWQFSMESPTQNLELISNSYSFTPKILNQTW